jgi:hypothetical protein
LTTINEETRQPERRQYTHTQELLIFHDEHRPWEEVKRMAAKIKRAKKKNNKENGDL